MLSCLQALKVKVMPAMQKGMVDGMRDFEGHIIETQMSEHSENSLGVGIGAPHLRSSWHITPHEEGKDSFNVSLANSTRYGKIHQTGGTIHSKGKMLTIPISADAKGHFARDFSDLFVIKGNKGPLLVRGKGDQLEIMYALKNSVTIPKRLHVYEEFATFGRKQVGLSIRRELEKLSTK